MPITRKYGLKPTTPDPRDFKMKFTKVTTFPVASFNRKFCSPVEDQLDLGSCTANTGTSNWEVEYRKLLGQEVVFSRRYLYYKERELEGTLPNDEGAEMRTICRAITKFGICLESDMPYDVAQQAEPPTPEQERIAGTYRSGAYHTLETLNDIKGCLTDLPGFPGHMFMLGFAVYSSFESSDLATTGKMPMPHVSSERRLGGHAVLVVDYDDRIVCPGANAGAVLIQNSWGTSWGIKARTKTRGYFWMPYDFILSEVSEIDMRILHYGKPW